MRGKRGEAFRILLNQQKATRKEKKQKKHASSMRGGKNSQKVLLGYTKKVEDRRERKSFVLLT